MSIAVKSRVWDIVPPVAAVIVMIVGWEVLVDQLNIPLYILPAPSEIVRALFASKFDWLANSWVTLFEAGAGFGLAIAVGLPLSMLLAYSQALNRVIYPLVVLMQLVPRIAIAPIIFVLLGFGAAPRVLITFLVCLFPVIVETIAGLNSLDPDHVDLMRSLGASNLQIFKSARLPNALPFIFSGVKVSVTLSFVGAVVAEFVNSSMGLGFILFNGLLALGSVLAFAAIVILAVLGLGSYAGVLVVERLSISWYFRSKEGGQ